MPDNKGRPRDGGIAGAGSWAGEDLRLASTIDQAGDDAADPALVSDEVITVAEVRESVDARCGVCR